MSRNNHNIERVAIVGTRKPLIQILTLKQATERIGGYFAEVLLKTGKHTVTALQRTGSTRTPPAGALTAPVDYDDPGQESLIAALKGQQTLIIALSVHALADLQGRIIQAAVIAGVRWIMPNVWSTDIFDASLRAEPYFGAFADTCLEIEALGAKYMVMVCELWYEWSLACGEPWFGFDFKGRRATLFDDGETKVGSSTWVQCARALATLLSLPEEGGAGVRLQRWKNNALYVSSFRVQETSDLDWAISRQPSDERREEGREEIQKGRRLGKHGVADQVLGLPQEDLDEATKKGGRNGGEWTDAV
ncbi:MAG: hypothetical protein Q9173_003395 [Seirophora scorigena]